MTAPFDVKKFKRQLLALKAEIEAVAQLVNTAAQPVELDQNKVGRLSRMDAMQSQAMAQASAQRQQDVLQKIQTALENIEHGEFGRCLECDQWIAEGRLLIDPTASHCVACAGVLEL